MNKLQLSKLKKHIAYMDKINPAYAYECGVVAHYSQNLRIINPYIGLVNHENERVLFDKGLLNPFKHNQELEEIPFVDSSTFQQGKEVAFKNPGYNDIRRLIMMNPYMFFTEQWECFQMGFLQTMIEKHVTYITNKKRVTKRFCLVGPKQNYEKLENFINFFMYTKVFFGYLGNPQYLSLCRRQVCIYWENRNTEIRASIEGNHFLEWPCTFCNHKQANVFNIEKTLISMFGEIVGKHLYATYLLF